MSQEKTFTRELEVDLGEAELQLYGKMLAEKVQEEGAIEEQKKLAMKEYASRLSKVRNEIARIASARSKGRELRPITCVERFNGGMVEIVRTDKNEVVDTRPATFSERQTEFPGIDEDDQGELPIDNDEPFESDAPVDAEVDHDGVDVVASSGATVHVMPDEPDIEPEPDVEPEPDAPKKTARSVKAGKAKSKKKGK